MSANRRRSQSGLGYTVRKFGLSAFVVSTFATYAIHEHLIGADATVTPLTGSDPGSLGQLGSAPAAATLASFPSNVAQRTTAIPTAAPVIPTTVPTSVPAPATTPAGPYKDGAYTGPSVDAYYGSVQVEAVVRNGQLADVQFLDYPHDRRTSQRINSQATPWLTQEAIQAQSARVNLISGATLTSEAFVESLSTALQSARSAV